MSKKGFLLQEDVKKKSTESFGEWNDGIRQVAPLESGAFSIITVVQNSGV